MRSLQIYTILFFLSLSISLISSQPYSTDFNSQTLIPQTNSLYNLSPQDEIINGVNYGPLISIASRIWLMKTKYNLPRTYTSFKNPCPNGWMLPTLEDITNLVNVTAKDPLSILKNSSLFDMDPSLYYMSSEKAYPLSTSGSLSKSWAFYGIKFLSTGEPQIAIINSYFSGSYIRGICVRKKSSEFTSLSDPALILKGIDEKDLYKGLKYILSINNTNIIAYSWTLGACQSSSKYLDLIPMKEGLFQLDFKVQLFDGSIIGDSRKLWVRNYTGSEATTSFTLNDLNNVAYPFYEYRNLWIHFNSGSAPLAPKEEGGAYIIYAERGNMFLHVKTIDNDGKQLQDLNLTVQGYPFDIISIGYGWVALIKDYNAPNKLYLLSMDNNNQTIFQRTLINAKNNTPTTRAEDDLVFYKDSTGTPLFGLNAMFNPNSGKLAFGKGRLAVIFSHYNFFGYNSDGTRSDHTGDTIFTIDLTGKNEKIANSWGASHSLTQNLIYAGSRFMSAALGDAYPLNIMFTTEEGSISNGKKDPFTGLENILDVTSTSSLLADILTGDGLGHSNGRLGNLIQLADGLTYVLSYARRKGSANFNGQTYTSEINELGLLFFDFDLKFLKDVYLGEGQWVNQVQSCRYGKNIFVSYVISNNRLTPNGQFLDPKLNTDDLQYFILLDENGNLLTGPLLLEYFNPILPASDELKMMSDGRCAWTYVDENYILNYIYLTPPEQTPTSYTDVLNSQFYNKGDFYMINSYDMKDYKMGKVKEGSQTYLNLMDLGMSKLSLITTALKIHDDK